MVYELKNLKIGKVDPALFEVPSGYDKAPATGGWAARTAECRTAWEGRPRNRPASRTPGNPG
ncbi:MAG: hypothetical protein HY098_08990 [Nitrospinae bacterium]|nr:hypothetical protein [Nitrospinota bacterium]